jgi:hypothetical protein
MVLAKIQNKSMTKLMQMRNVQATTDIDGNVVVEFSAPFTYVLITKLGPKRLLNLVKPRVESITITPKSYILKLSTFGNYEVER